MDPNSVEPTGLHLAPFTALLGLALSLGTGAIVTYVSLMSKVERVIKTETGALRDLLTVKLNALEVEVGALERRVERLENWLHSLRWPQKSGGPRGDPEADAEE